MGNARISFSDLNGNGQVDVPVEILQENHYYPFGMAQKGPWMNNNAGDDSKYLYNGKELIADHGLNIYAYGFRYYDPAVARFVSVDPLADKFPYLTTYQYASNTPINAIDLDGLEAFYVHGTNETESGDRFSKKTINQFRKISGNTAEDRKFRWYAPLLNSKDNERSIAATLLVDYVISTRNELIENGTISENEPVTLIGYSHGGNVSIQAAESIAEKTGMQVNLITVATPAQEGSNNTENPTNNPAINEHIQIVHNGDQVARNAGDLKFPGSKLHKVTNYIINGKIDDGPSIRSIDRHTELPNSSQLPQVLKKIPMLSSPKPYTVIKEKK